MDVAGTGAERSAPPADEEPDGQGDDQQADGRLGAALYGFREVVLGQHDRQAEREQRSRMAEAPYEPERARAARRVVMVVVAYFYGAPALVTATAVTALVTMLWLLHRGVHGYVQNASASVFALVYAHKKHGIIPAGVLELGRADDSSVVRAVLIQNEKVFAIYAASQNLEWSRITSQP